MTATQSCERCGVQFGCQAGSDDKTPCWCASVALDEATRAALADRFERCLCPACLAEAGQPPAGSEPRTLRSGRTSAVG
jgi:hypothetical protein